MTNSAVQPVAPQGHLAPPAELSKTVSDLVAEASQLTIASDTDYEGAVKFLNDIGRGIVAVEAFFQPHKAGARSVWQALVDDEKKQLAPLETARAILRDQKMKPYWLRRERERAEEKRRREDQARREAEERRRQEIEAARKEAEELARFEREAAAERARVEREAAERQALEVEREALARVDKLLADGKEADAQRILDDAQQRQQNLIDDAEDTAQVAEGIANEIAERVLAEGEAVAQEMALAPVHTPIVQSPAPLRARGSSAAKKYKSDRTTFDKRKAVEYIAAEVARGNIALLSWVDLNFAEIDASARQMRDGFPAAAVCGISVGEDVNIRGSLK